MARLDLQAIRGQTAITKRYAMYRFNKSVAEFEIPSWFVNDRDTLYVTATGGGGSAGAPSTAYTGSGGGSAGSVLRAPLKLWGEIRTLRIDVGAAGAAAATASSGGSTGGISAVRIPSSAGLIVAGYGGGGGIGGAAPFQTVGQGGNGIFSGSYFPSGNIPVDSNLVGSNLAAFTNYLIASLHSGPRAVFRGRDAYDGGVAATAAATMTMSGSTRQTAGLFGGGVGTVGYGYGYGARQHTALGNVAGTEVGGPGFVILEFEEN